jgi:hypothetical protein
MWVRDTPHNFYTYGGGRYELSVGALNINLLEDYPTWERSMWMMHLFECSWVFYCDDLRKKNLLLQQACNVIWVCETSDNWTLLIFTSHVCIDLIAMTIGLTGAREARPSQLGYIHSLPCCFLFHVLHYVCAWVLLRGTFLTVHLRNDTYDILFSFIIKVNILVLIKWSYSPPHPNTC